MWLTPKSIISRGSIVLYSSHDSTILGAERLQSTPDRTSVVPMGPRTMIQKQSWATLKCQNPPLKAEPRQIVTKRLGPSQPWPYRNLYVIRDTRDTCLAACACPRLALILSLRLLISRLLSFARSLLRVPPASKVSTRPSRSYQFLTRLHGSAPALQAGSWAQGVNSRAWRLSVSICRLQSRLHIQGASQNVSRRRHKPSHSRAPST